MAMLRNAIGLLALLGGSGLTAAQSSNVTSESVDVQWIGQTPNYLAGATFGVPWARGKYDAKKTSFTASTSSGDVELQSWVTGYWPDGSIKWSAHAVPAESSAPTGYTITALGTGVINSTGPGNSTCNGRRKVRRATGMATSSGDEIVVDTGKIKVSFPTSGSVLTVGTNGRLVLRSQSAIVDYEDDVVAETPIEHYEFSGRIENATVDDASSTRALVTVAGTHQVEGTSAHDPWLPFTVRFYLYKNSEAIRIVHSIVYDRNATEGFITGLGIRFDVPLVGEELYDRHVRLAGPDGGMLSEAVQGITGLRRDPGAAVRTAQFQGKKTANASTWDTRVTSRLQWIPPWNDYRLTQLSPDGFNLQKRTKQGQSWVKISGATRSGGLAYLGGPTAGGLAVGLRDFWKRYPTSLDISNAATDTGRITLWLYSPSAPPMDLRPYHDGLGEDTYAKQLDALEITYEDYEPGWNTPNGVGRTNEIYVYAFDETPSQDTLAVLTSHTNEPPALLASPEHIQKSGALGTWWGFPGANANNAASQAIESHLDFLLQYYREQVETRRWYGFWDHGDFHHSYDPDRHTWRYDIGGYAWDNSELSTDNFFWTQFLRTGDPAVYRFAEAQVRHGGEVDSYHSGIFKGLGTRHGIQHWGDSAKQARISTPIYRRVFYYVSGGDERTGDLVREVLSAEQAFVTVDARRKVRDPSVVYVPDPKALYISIGIDWSGMAIAWLMEWERLGPRWQEARSKILRGATTIPQLKNGFVTGEALYNSEDGSVSPPPTDPNNNGNVTVSHLSGSFGMLETITQIIDHLADETPAGFEEAFVDYCTYYGATAAEQIARYGVSFGNVNLKQGHSRFTAYAAYKRNNATLAARAWKEFFNTDGYTAKTNWTSTLLNGSDVLVPVPEAAWVNSNDLALYGIASIQNLALVGGALAANSP
ncbi:hypothetical protein GQ53DRAFT_797976 [Thozetella sp. PMI_491]|nr:hypothetical protein GQ53DRAFT_797976 [Thozetella sp. PMI_491]